jgi:hypothetical protein
MSISVVLTCLWYTQAADTTAHVVWICWDAGILTPLSHWHQHGYDMRKLLILTLTEQPGQRDTQFRPL